MKKRTKYYIKLIIIYIIASSAAIGVAGTIDPMNGFSFGRTVIQELVCIAVIFVCFLIGRRIIHNANND